MTLLSAIDSGAYDHLILTVLSVLCAVLWLRAINGGDKW